MPELKRKQKGLIGETLYASPSRVNPNFHPKLFNFLLSYLDRNYQDKVNSVDVIDLEIVRKTSNRDLEKYEQITWRYQKGEPSKEDGEIISYSDVPAWRPDAVVLVEFGEVPDKEIMEFPLEIKTGKDGRIYHEQREAFIHVAEEET